MQKDAQGYISGRLPVVLSAIMPKGGLQKRAQGTTIAADMDATRAKDKLAADRVVLLGILVVGVLLGRLLVSVRSKIDMSSPIKLDFAGLSVSMPSGEGWTCADRWTYEETSGESLYMLGGAFVAGEGQRPGTRVLCVCTPVFESATAAERLENLASRLNARIVQASQIESGNIAFDWAQILDETGRVNVLFGTADLAYGRQLDIKIREDTGDMAWAWNVFEQIVCSVRVDDALLKAGNDLVESVKFRGVGSFLANQNRQRLFIVKDTSGASVGFKMDVFVDMGDQDELPIQAAGAHYLKDESVWDHAISFFAEDDLSQFEWNSRAINMIGRQIVSGSRIDVVLDQSGVIAVMEANVLDRKYRPGPLAVPRILLELFVVQMFKQGIEQCVIDLIDEDGRVTPVVVSEISAEQARGDLGNDKIEYAAKLEYQYLGGQDSYRRMYFDGDKRVILEAVKREKLLFLERASGESLAKEFPERADLLLNSDKLKEKLGRDRD